VATDAVEMYEFASNGVYKYWNLAYLSFNFHHLQINRSINQIPPLFSLLPHSITYKF